MKQRASCSRGDSSNCCSTSYFCQTSAEVDASCPELCRSTTASTTYSNTASSSISRTCSNCSGTGRMHQEDELEEFECSRRGATEERTSSSTFDCKGWGGSSTGSGKRNKSILSSVLRHYWEVGTSFRWGCRRSSAVGISCLFYLLPCLVLPLSSSNSISPRRKFESCMWGFVALASFLSDFVFSGQRHHRGVRAVHMTDRWLASFALMLQCLYNLPLWFSVSFYVGYLGLVLVLCCCALKASSTLASSYEEYVWTHTAWHVAGAAARCVMACLEGH